MIYPSVLECKDHGHLVPAERVLRPHHQPGRSRVSLAEGGVGTADDPGEIVQGKVRAVLERADLVDGEGHVVGSGGIRHGDAVTVLTAHVGGQEDALLEVYIASKRIE